MAKHIPPKLYKYQSLATPYTRENLQKRQIWFSKPESLNDPFDCAVPFRLLKIGEKEWEIGYRNLQKRIEKDLGADKVKEADNQFLTNGKLNSFFRNTISKINADNLDRNQEKFKDYGVACFSEDNSNILMWSHYSDGHKGLCLEFDTKYFPFEDVSKIHRVIYQNRYPVLSPVAFITKDFFPFEPALTKSRNWKYEKEWRILHQPGNIALEYDPRALTAIYFGCSMLDKVKNDIANLRAKAAPRLFQMQRSKTEFKLEVVPYTL